MKKSIPIAGIFLILLSCHFPANQEEQEVSNRGSASLLKAELPGLDTLPTGHYLFLLIAEKMCSPCIKSELDYVGAMRLDKKLAVLGFFHQKRIFLATVSQLKGTPKLYFNSDEYTQLDIAASITPLYLVTDKEGVLIDFLQTNEDHAVTSHFLEKYIGTEIKMDAISGYR